MNWKQIFKIFNSSSEWLCRLETFYLYFKIVAVISKWLRFLSDLHYPQFLFKFKMIIRWYLLGEIIYFKLFFTSERFQSNFSMKMKLQILKKRHINRNSKLRDLICLTYSLFTSRRACALDLWRIKQPCMLITSSLRHQFKSFPTNLFNYYWYANEKSLFIHLPTSWHII